MEIPKSYSCMADFARCVAEIGGNVHLKFDETPKPNLKVDMKANEFLINTRNKVGEYIVIDVGEGTVRNYLSGTSGTTNIMGVHVSPKMIETVWELDNSKSNENAAYITGDNYPWEALENVERKSTAKTTYQDNTVKVEYIFEAPEMKKSPKIANEFFERFKKGEFLKDPLTNLMSRLAYITRNVGIEIGADGVYHVHTSINENEYATFTTTDQLLQASDGKCFVVGGEESGKASLLDVGGVIADIMERKQNEKEKEIQMGQKLNNKMQEINSAEIGGK